MPTSRSRPGAVLLVPLAVALVLTLFAWPNAKLEPRDLPIAVAGPSGAASTIERQLAADDGAFDIKRYPDEAAARDAIANRDVYGAFVAQADGVKVLTAQAASPTVAQLLGNAANSMRASPGAGAVKVQEAAPAPAESSALASSILPMILAGTITAAVSMTFGSTALRRAALVVAGSALAGATAAVIVQSWLGVLEGDWLANAGALSLMVLSIAAFVAGLQALFGTAGTAAGAMTMILVGNPFAGINTSPDMLPRPTGFIGQLMPPGAGGNLLRSTGYFDGAAAGGHIAVLTVWAVVGLTLLLAGAVRARKPVGAPVPVPA